MTDCLICNIAEGKIPAVKVHEDAEVVAFRDIKPAAPTHIVLAPRTHVPTVNDLQDHQSGLVGTLVMRARDLAKKEGIAERGYRLVMNCNPEGGQSVFHIHLHLIGGRVCKWPPG